ncbi:MAG: helix-turn-helix transcriptional regulator [Prevotella sp.]|nr:helix-turn-helix transcriptional regulator [Prevotella sp.]
MERKINRIKVMLAEKGKTNKWLATQLGKDPATVSKGCTNAAQPTLETMMLIAKMLEVGIEDLVRFEALPDVEIKEV